MRALNNFNCKILLAAMFFTLTVYDSFVHAQEKNTGNSIATLHFLEGNWEIDNYELQDRNWKLLGRTSAKISLEHNGKFVSEKVKYLTKFGEINMITNIGFDQRLEKFKLCAMDKEYGYMDIYIGQWINNDLVFTNLESDVPIILDDGTELSFRLTYSKKSEKAFTHLVEGTYNKGETWFSFSKSTYVKNN